MSQADAQTHNAHAAARVRGGSESSPPLAKGGQGRPGPTLWPLPSGSDGSVRAAWPALVALLLASGGWPAAIFPADIGDPPRPAARVEGAQPAPDPQAAARTRAQQRRLMAGLVIVAGILALGLALIALVIVWGHRARGVSRRPLDSAAEGDPLWFLKPEKPASESPARGPGDDAAAGDDDERPPAESP